MGDQANPEERRLDEELEYRRGLARKQMERAHRYELKAVEYCESRAKQYEEWAQTYAERARQCDRRAKQYEDLARLYYDHARQLQPANPADEAPVVADEAVEAAPETSLATPRFRCKEEPLPILLPVSHAG